MANRNVHGDLKAFSIFDVTQSLLMGRKTAVVTVISGEKKGFISFKEGQIVAATDDTLSTGEKAAMNVFAWTGGTFSIDFDKEPEAANIRMPTDSLLLEVARNLDEIRHENGIAPPGADAKEEETEDVSGSLQERLQAELRQKLNAIFKRVASSAEPVRARYTKSAFDFLLQALVDLGGSGLFLRPGARPRVKTAQGFATIKDEPIAPGEIEGFLACILSEAETIELREEKETTTFFHTPTLGAFRLQVVSEHGALLLAFTPASRSLPPLADLLPDARGSAALAAIHDGLIVVAGPMGSGKAAVVSSIVQEHLRSRDAFAVVFSPSGTFTFAADRGLCVHRTMPPTSTALASAVRAAIDQNPEVLAFAGDHGAEGFLLALGASGGHRLVITVVESQTPADALQRLLRLSRTADGDALLDPLADRLRAIIDVGAGVGDTIAIDHVTLVDRAFQDLLRAGQIDALRRRRLSSATV